MRGVEWRKWVLVVAVVAAGVVKARFAWVPVWYLVAAVGTPALGWWAFRGGSGRRVRWPVAGVAAAVTVGLCPVPWMVAETGGTPGNAWRLDGRVTIDGRTIDPAGEWLWLTAGRPPTIAELAWAKVADTPESVAPSTMRAGPLRKRAKWSEPAAAVVGLARGGWAIDTRLEAHLSEPTVDGLPESVVVTSINGRQFDNAAEWVTALDQLRPQNTMRTAAGTDVGFAGTVLPYARVDTVVAPTRDIEVVVGGWLARTPAGGWWRNLATGSSHGLMVALVAYTYASGDDLGSGITVAGTGSIRPDGSVGRIGGLRAKAGAARDAGADVLLYPAGQADDLAGFSAGSMTLIGVDSLDEAIVALDARRGR